MRPPPRRGAHNYRKMNSPKYPFLTAGNDGTYIMLRIHPGSSKKGISGLHGDALKIKLFAQPVEGAANKALIALLSKALGIKKSSIEITSGERSKDKRVFIEGVTIEELEEVFLERFKDL